MPRRRLIKGEDAMKILTTSRYNNFGDYKINNTNAFLIKSDREWKLCAGNNLSVDVYADALHNGWIDTFKRKKDAIQWVMFNEKLAESNGVEFDWKEYRVDCDICGDYHNIDGVPMACQTGDGE